MRESKDVKEPMLDPKNLIYFGRLIFEEKFVEEEEIARISKTIFDTMLGYSLVFRTKDDFNLCHELIKQAISHLESIKSHINQVSQDDDFLTKFFSNKLIQGMAGKLNLSEYTRSDR